MSAPRGRIRGFIRPPTPEQVKALGALEHMSLTDDEAQQYSAVLGGVLSAIDRLDELTQPTPKLKYTDRDPGRVPTAEEDPYHAFIRFVEVRGAQIGPLARLRVGVKDNLAVAGIPVTNASRSLSYTPTVDALVVERLLDAGADIVGKTNLDDFSTSGTGESSFYGPARNAVDPSRSSGGSSGGSGSAVRSGIVDIALGVDEGGSARIPASFNGVVSLMATHGLVPSHGLTYMDHTIDYVCPIARDVETVAKAIDAISGHSTRDPQWMRGTPGPTNTLATLGDGVAGLRIGVVQEATREENCDPGVLQGFADACEALTKAGATVVPVSVPLWSEAWSIELALLCHLGWGMAQSDGIGFGHMGEVDVERAHGFGLVRRMEADAFPPFFKTWLLAGRYLSDTYYSTYLGKAQNLRRALKAEIDAALVDCDLLVTPTTPQVAPKLLDRPANDEELLSRGTTMVANTSPLNLSGHPALAVPSGADADGMPTSIQIIGREFTEALTLRAGAVVEAAVGATPGKSVRSDDAALAMSQGGRH